LPRRRTRSKPAIVFIAFDVLAVDGRAVAGEPYRERRRRLEALDLGSP
jgi:ATP-dependent DNA ligase